MKLLLERSGLAADASLCRESRAGWRITADVVHTFNPVIPEVEAGGCEFKHSLVYILNPRTSEAVQ